MSCNGASILPALRLHDAALHSDVAWTIANFSKQKGATPDAPDRPVELTSGFRLLGTPVGSSEYTASFFDDQLQSLRADIDSLHANIADLHTRLKLFAQCTAQRLPHLLGADIMHSLPLDYDGNWDE